MALDKAQHLLYDDMSELYWNMCHWPIELNSELEDCRSRLTRFRTRYMTQLKIDQTNMTKDLADLKGEVERFIQLGDLKQVRAAVSCTWR